MAGHMKFLILILSLVAGLARGESLADPTRPPASFVSEAQGEATVDAGPRLQSVMLPRQGRPAAVISGRTIRRGEMWGDSRLVQVSENEVVLEGPQGRQRLLLTPDASKVMIKEKSGKALHGRQRETP